MLTSTFRLLLENEIGQIVPEIEKQNPEIKAEDQKKSFAFLHWFLINYYPEKRDKDFKSKITEGNDDGSCDIIFTNKNRSGEKVFYVIQAKWFNIKNASKTNKTGELVKSCISDFELIITGKAPLSKTNQKFNEQYKKLKKHIKRNGKVKFIFLPLCERTKSADNNINKFNDDNQPLISLELYDINKLKLDYIELKFKEVKTHNPLETPYEPIDKIKLAVDIENRISIKEPDESYIFLVKPKLIHELFAKYQFSLFYRNIRNPLFKSTFNQAISNTLLENPKRFWYYNNGITAITNKINPFNKTATEITVQGIQIINGAQTVYSIYQAYNNSDEEKKAYIDERVVISMRIITSSNSNEDLKITKFTNSQNPVTARDFHANDEVQKKIQAEFFINTDIWFEIRRSEFRKKIDKKLRIKIVSNELIGQCYLSYFLLKPILAKSSKTNIFLSSLESSKGLYDDIFNSDTNYEDMWISYQLYQLIEMERKNHHGKIKKLENEKEFHNYTEAEKELVKYKFLQYTSFNFLAWFNILFKEINKKDGKGLNGRILSDLKNNSGKIPLYYKFIKDSTKDMVQAKSNTNKFKVMPYFKSNPLSVLEVKKELLKNLDLKTRKKLQL